MEQEKEEERKREEYAKQVCMKSLHMYHHNVVLLFQLEQQRAEKRKSRTRQFFGLGSSNKTSSPSTAVATSNPPADDGQELDDLISALRSADIFTEDIKRRKHKKGKSTKTTGDSSKHRLI